MNQASIFTLQKSGNIYEDFDTFPSELYVDTSAWITAYNGKSYNPVREFMGDCLNNNTTLYHSEMVLSEAVHVNEKAHYDIYADEYIPRARYHGNVNQKKLRELIRRDHPEILDNIRVSQNQLLHSIRTSSIFLEYEANEEMVEEVLRIQQASGNLLGVNDAKHVYIARQYGINSFLTTDRDFIALDNDNIYVLRNEKYIQEKIGRNNVFLEFDANKY